MDYKFYELQIIWIIRNFRKDKIIIKIGSLEILFFKIRQRMIDKDIIVNF